MLEIIRLVAALLYFFDNNRNGSLGFKALMSATAHIIVSHLLRVPPHGVYPTVQTFCVSAARNECTIICQLHVCHSTRSCLHYMSSQISCGLLEAKHLVAMLYSLSCLNLGIIIRGSYISFVSAFISYIQSKQLKTLRFLH